MKKNILILKQICKCIQKKTVRNQCYMNIQNGEIVNLIGMEDSGKEDVFSILFGQEKIDSGEIVFNRRSYTQMSQRIVEHAGGIFFINNDELQLLTSWRRPIVLLRERQKICSNGLNDGYRTLGVMLPYMLIHHDLFQTERVTKKDGDTGAVCLCQIRYRHCAREKSGRTECIRTAYPESTAGICQAGKADCDQ